MHIGEADAQISTAGWTAAEEDVTTAADGSRHPTAEPPEWPILRTTFYRRLTDPELALVAQVEAGLSQRQTLIWNAARYFGSRDPDMLAVLAVAVPDTVRQAELLAPDPAAIGVR
jgi:hypothetical protein